MVGRAAVWESRGGKGDSAWNLTGLNQPYGLTVSASGQVYVSTLGSGAVAIYKYAADGLSRTTVATGATLLSPHGMAVDGNGNLFVADFNRIDKFTPGGVQSQFGAASSGAQAVAFSPSGTLFLTNSQTQIYKYDSLGTPTLFGVVPTAVGGLAFDTAGTMYVSDRGSTFTDGSLYKFDSAGNRTTFVASGLSDPQMGVANALPTPEPSSVVLLSLLPLSRSRMRCLHPVRQLLFPDQSSSRVCPLFLSCVLCLWRTSQKASSVR